MTDQPYAALVCRLMVSNPVIPVNYMDYYSLTHPGGWKVELAWMVDRSGHVSVIDQA